MMKRTLAKGIILGISLLLGACSSLSQEECAAMSWYNLGFADGEQGKAPDASKGYADSCGEYGIRVDQAEWQRGYKKGLELYCIPELAYRKGREGSEYQGVCPNDETFLRQFERGRQEYQLAARLNELSNAISQNEQDIYQLEQRIRKENDSAQRDSYRYQRERAIRRDRALRDEYNRLRYPPRVIEFKL
ncbi:DUF2799 domain-containing protein [Aeromonas molluscorum]|jgi:hypothetical protein|uniref:DNA repair ATPase n=1 Tax=Aeromonas molluscorum 848 TaxID=1268236 RepID=R1GRZ6_9GAMM|nr:DUF2799 domain-containing protein [Aeromonas molluscorum]EOD54440.1 hypothetical protein G113_14371 [Aeromonas molluscorum 848]